MNANAKKWLKALRSGKYDQTRGVLCRLDHEGNTVGYCCLGVACEVFLEENPGGLRLDDRPFSGGTSPAKMYDGATASLPDAVRLWLGLTTSTGNFKHGERALSTENDDGKTFQQIAGMITRYQEELFPNEKKGGE